MTTFTKSMTGATLGGQQGGTGDCGGSGGGGGEEEGDGQGWRSIQSGQGVLRGG